MAPYESDFWTFHADNPQVYTRLVSLARRLVERGHSTIGIGMLFEVLRWHHAMTTNDAASDFKLNNNYRALYARLIMTREGDLDGVFRTRELQGDDPFGGPPPPLDEPEVRDDDFDPERLFA